MLDPIPRVCLVWNWQTRKNRSRKAHFWPKSPRVVSWEPKTNSSGGLCWCEVNCSRHKAHDGLGLEVNSNLLMGSPHLAPLPEFVRHSPHATSVITRELQSCEITGTAPLLLFLILCLFFFFFLFPPDCLPFFPCQLPQLSTPPFLKRHISWCDQNFTRQTDVVRGPTCGRSDRNESAPCEESRILDFSPIHLSPVFLLVFPVTYKSTDVVQTQTLTRFINTVCAPISWSAVTKHFSPASST